LKLTENIMAETEKETEKETKPVGKMSETDKVIEEAKKKAAAEKAKRIMTADQAALSEEQLKSISLEKRVRKYIRPDGLFRKGLSESELDQAKQVLEKAGRKIAMDKEEGRPRAIPGWDESIDTRRPLINS
jgi:hypothetical protein